MAVVETINWTLSCIVIIIVGHLWRHKHASHYEKEEVQKKYTSDKFVCNFDGCMVTFDTQPELVEHVTTHTTDKACMCSECGATFVSLPNLAKHRRRRHGDQAPPTYKGYRCEMCDKTFLTSYQLVVHFRLDQRRFVFNRKRFVCLFGNFLWLAFSGISEKENNR